MPPSTDFLPDRMVNPEYIKERKYALCKMVIPNARIIVKINKRK